jgi:hypothetical protein
MPRQGRASAISSGARIAGLASISGFVEDPSRPIDNLNVYVTDAE